VIYAGETFLTKLFPPHPFQKNFKGRIKIVFSIAINKKCQGPISSYSVTNEKISVFPFPEKVFESGGAGGENFFQKVHTFLSRKVCQRTLSQSTHLFIVYSYNNSPQKVFG
jgi:hypothetical protein